MSGFASIDVLKTGAKPAPFDLIAIVAIALAIRLVFFNGFFGSDDLTYYKRAVELANGEWLSANYNGALRYGFNLPAAFFVAIFGKSAFAANLWPLICSLAEICLVYIFAASAISVRAGWCAALLLAVTPIHIAVSTRIHADSVVSMFVTLSFVLIYFGATSKRASLLFAAGLAIGGIYWAKELAAVTWFAFLPMLYLFREYRKGILFVAAGVLSMMALHGVLMYGISNDPFHLVKVVLGALKTNFVEGGQGEDGAFYYFKYLFIDLRHVAFLGILALLSLLGYKRAVLLSPDSRMGMVFAVVWGISLLTVLSLFPVSLSPIRFTMKQSNYLTLFIAPLAVLAGVAVASLSKVWRCAILGISLVCGVVLGGLEQADYRAFTANSKALAEFAALNPRSVVVGSTNNSSMGNLWIKLAHPESTAPPILSFKELAENSTKIRTRVTSGEPIFVAFDRQTMHWFAGKFDLKEPRPCWTLISSLKPSDLGLGNDIARVGSTLTTQIKPLSRVLDSVAQPRKADLYRVSGTDPLCS